MCFRIFYSIREGWRNRQQLRDFLQEPRLQVMQIQDIFKADLVARGVKALVLDYDGVLAAHGELVLQTNSVQYLQDYFQNPPVIPIYILSNKPKLERQKYFTKNFPAITFIIPRRKKPYPDGLEQIIQMTNLEPREVLLVDDRLGTGILATIIAKTQGLLVTHPIVNVRTRPIVESWFILLRWLEKKLIKLIT